MARRREGSKDLGRDVESAFADFRETQLGRLSTTSTRENPWFIRDLPLEAQERHVAAALQARARVAPADDWVHEVLKDGSK